jgi:predicted secreted hydrolase
MERRRILRLLACAALGPALPTRALAGAPLFPAVVPRPLVFPRDHGAHADFRTEWWYVTGWLDAAGEAIGFQVTFFRTRTGHDTDNPSRFAPHQLLFAHAALAQRAAGRLRYDQRAARVVRDDPATRFGSLDTDLALQGWRLRRYADGHYETAIDGQGLQLELVLTPSQPLLLQGDGGFSAKGAQPDRASYYYSQPQLTVGGRIALAGRRLTVSGRAWLDHEWSSQVLNADSAGWDWLGIDLDDGAALMAFRIRARGGDEVRWAAARLRQADGRARSFGPGEVRFEPLTRWRSPRTGTVYPVAGVLTLGQADQALRFEIQPLMADQELDARLTTGTVYWEGAVSVLAGGRKCGSGYQELVGYYRPIRL